ncbi:MAG: NAD-dependent epimerase, partial [Deltaproteobacteria bacterium]|nr:NAD-dependent epimerase [Deltaproteobacteria bacterium]
PPAMLVSTIKARQAGFHECMDTEDMFRKWFKRFQELRLLPPV